MTKRRFSLGFDALHVHCCWALFAVLDIECDFVTFAEIVKLDANQGLAVEEQVFFLAFASDEAETTIGQLLDNTLHRIG